MAIEQKLVQHLAKLSRLKMDAYEEEHITKDLDRILAHIDTLKNVDTQSIEPTHQTTNLNNVIRADIITEKHDRDHMLESVPAKEGGYITIKKVL